MVEVSKNLGVLALEPMGGGKNERIWPIGRLAYKQNNETRTIMSQMSIWNLLFYSHDTCNLDMGTSIWSPMVFSFRLLLNHYELSYSAFAAWSFSIWIKEIHTALYTTCDKNKTSITNLRTLSTTSQLPFELYKVRVCVCVWWNILII